VHDPLVKAEQKGSTGMGLCNAGSHGAMLKTLLPGEDCAIRSYCAKDYIKPQGQILSQNLQSHRIWALWPPTRDLTRKMLWRLSSYSMFALSSSPGDFGKVSLRALHLVLNGDTCPQRGALTTANTAAAPSSTCTEAILDFVHRSGLAGTVVVSRGASPWP